MNSSADKPSDSGGQSGERSALVTGASGFIGRALATRLVNDGWRVGCIGRRDPEIQGAEFLRVESLTEDALQSALAGKTFNAVFHLAAYGVTPGDTDPTTVFNVNVAGTAAVVKSAAAIGANTIVYAGSCSEYSEAEAGTPIEENHPLTTHGLYGASKAAGGLWGQALSRRFGIRFIWLRLFGVYGAGEAPHRLLPAIAARLSKNLPAALSPGDQIRDVLYIDDVVEGLIKAAGMTHTSAAGAFNLCSGQAVSVRSLALAIADTLGKPRDLLEFGAIPRRPNEAMWLVGSGTSFRSAVGFLPRVSLEAGLAQSLELLGQPKD